MDPLSVAASVAGIAATGLQLSQTIYDLVTTFTEAENEMMSVANNLSLLAAVFIELEGVLRRDSRVYRHPMIRAVNDILKNCEGIFQNISKYISVMPRQKLSKQFRKKVLWYFQRHRVRPLQAGLESMKSTLNVLLHVVQLARITEAAESFMYVLRTLPHRASRAKHLTQYRPNAGTMVTDADVQKERKVLVGVVLDNRRSILGLKQIEEDRDRGKSLRNIIGDKHELEGTADHVTRDDSASTSEHASIGSSWDWDLITSKNKKGKNKREGKKEKRKEKGDKTRRPRDASLDPGLPARSASHTARAVKLNELEDEVEAYQASKGNRRTSNHTPIPSSTLMSRKTPISGEGSDTSSHKSEKSEKSRISKTSEEGSDLNPRRSNQDDEFSMRFDPSQGVNFNLKGDMEGQKISVRRNDEGEMEFSIGSRGTRNMDAEREGREKSHQPSSDKNVLSEIDVSEPSSSGVRPRSFNGDPERNSTIEDDLIDPSTSEGLPSQSPASEYFEMSPEVPIMDSTGSTPSDVDITTKPGRPAIVASAKGPAIKPKKDPESSPDMDTKLPTAQWFLSVVPHESNVTALVVRPRFRQANDLRARAEETAKTLLLNWTNIHPDSISEKDSGGWSYAGNSGSYHPRAATDMQIANQPYQTPYASQPYQAYPTYAPQQRYPYQPAVYNLPPPPPPATVSASPPPLNEDQTDREELARLKKLILDEKAEQDIRAAAEAPLPRAPSPPTASEESRKDTTPGENTFVEAVDSSKMSQDNSTLLKVEHRRLQPIIMRDWLGRKFIFPVIMCQTWEELHSLIQGAFGHELEYRSRVEEGKYLISNGTGECILPPTWEYFVQPGLEINMEILAFDTDRYDSSDKMIVGDRRDKASPEPLVPPHAPEVSSLGSPKTIRSTSDGERSVDDVTDDGTEYSYSDVISYVERSDPRYLSIEKVLLEQKQARVEAEMKLERNRRFFQLKQQLVDQGAAIQAREDAADRAEEESKLAWLEKRVRDQKEELDRLSPVVMTPPSSSAGDSLGKSTSSPPRKASFGARLLGRIPSPSIRSRMSVRGQQMITER